jgi:hypothetical protein
MASGNSFSPAGTALGLGGANGGSAADQVNNTETPEERRKRLAAIAQAQSRMPGSANYSPAGQALLNYGGGTGGGF